MSFAAALTLLLVITNFLVKQEIKREENMVDISVVNGTGIGSTTQASHVAIGGKPFSNENSGGDGDKGGDHHRDSSGNSSTSTSLAWYWWLGIVCLILLCICLPCAFAFCCCATLFTASMGVVEVASVSGASA
ncbi:hypothetical protein TYRP_009525 [Tyrophagus putrescentiae]|nr:hypothetical protein TYRP_009525 [Tyrophagus putrescentiae]